MKGSLGPEITSRRGVRASAAVGAAGWRRAAADRRAGPRSRRRARPLRHPVWSLAGTATASQLTTGPEGAVRPLHLLSAAHAPVGRAPSAGGRAPV